MSENIINNKAIAAATGKAAPQIVKAIKTASARTGVNFAYLMDQAAAESSFNSNARSRSSSATGLYQFIESTWIGLVKKYGPKHGLDNLAGMIGDNGKVSDKTTRQQILDLRKDPEKASLLAAEFAAENQRYLEQQVGGDIGSTELYLAHFLGAGGAAAFLKAHQDNPLATAADLFPREARANYNVFHDRKTGEPRTLAGIYDFFDRKFGGQDDAPAARAKAAPQAEAAAQQDAPRKTLPPVNRAALVMAPFGDERGFDEPRRAAPRLPSLPSVSLMADPAEAMIAAQLRQQDFDETPARPARNKARYAYND